MADSDPAGSGRAARRRDQSFTPYVSGGTSLRYDKAPALATDEADVAELTHGTVFRAERTRQVASAGGAKRTRNLTATT